jgi:hypothetical protein
MQNGHSVAALLLIAVGCGAITLGNAKSLRATNPPALVRTGHDNVIVDPSLRRYTGMVTAIGEPDREGRIYSFYAKPIGPGAMAPAPNEFRGWRLTVLAGKRFASVFEVQSNNETEVTVGLRDGPLNGLAVSDVFIVEEIGKEPQATSRAGS